MAANTFQNATRIARTAVGTLDLELVLGSTVWRDFDAEFTGGSGYTVNVRVPAKLTGLAYGDAFGEHTDSLTKAAITESVHAVKLNTMAYHLAPLTDEDLTLNIDSFESRVLMPQAVAVAEKVESVLATAMDGATYATTLNMDETDPWATIVAARKALNAAKVPARDRFLAVGSDIEADILSDENLLRRVDASGTDATLREGYIGRLGGFTVVPTNALPSDTAVAYHRSAFILATRAPVVPQGASAGAAASYGGYALRWIRDYDADLAQDRSFVSTFCGTKVVTDSSSLVRAVKITSSGS